MSRRGWYLSAVIAWIASLSAAYGPATPPAAEADDVSLPPHAAMARRIDALLEARWQLAGVTPAPAATDAEFLRRAYLDLTGRLPPVARVRRFLADANARKREFLIDELLASPAHANHLAATWRNIVLDGVVDFDQINAVLGVQDWLRRQFAENVRYDNLVADLLVASGGNESGPALFYTALELKPEKLAGATARIFLGLQIQCAECHDHPFDHWKQEDFWGYAAFFGRLSQSARRMSPSDAVIYDTEVGEVTLPGTERVVFPRYPGGEAPPPVPGGTRRRQLAIWMVSRDNPYLAPAVVNRAWAHMFGRGLVEPVDDLSENNPASHPELFQELTEYFIAGGFNLRDLFRTLATSRAYQLSSRVADERTVPPELFARMLLKPLTADQLFDALAVLRGRDANGRAAAPPGLADPERLAILAAIPPNVRSNSEFEAGPPLALLLMNGQLTRLVTDPSAGRLPQALDAPIFSDEDRLEALFLAALSRFPTDAERERLLGMFPPDATSEMRREVLADVLWALVNSAEFAMNH